MVAVREGHTPIEQELLVCNGNLYHMFVCFTVDLYSLVPRPSRRRPGNEARSILVGYYITLCFLYTFFFLLPFFLSLFPLPLSSLPLQRLQASTRGGTSCRSLSGEEEEEQSRPPSGAFLYLLHICLRNNRSESLFHVTISFPNHSTFIDLIPIPPAVVCDCENDSLSNVSVADQMYQC